MLCEKPNNVTCWNKYVCSRLFLRFSYPLQMASAVVFDKSLIVDAKEVPLLENRCNRVTPLVCEPGRLMISDKRIYFDRKIAFFYRHKFSFFLTAKSFT